MPAPPAAPAPEPPPSGAFARLVCQAGATLQAQGWVVVRRHPHPDAAWHFAVRRGKRWRVIQLVLPAAAPAERQRRRRVLGEAARLPLRLGSMEQWLGHVRPDGRVAFGRDVLHGQRWAESPQADEALARLDLGPAA
jgi:hypothetical protein